MSSPLYSRILIYGVGLMGSSLAMGIEKKYSGCQLTGIVRSEKSKSVCKSLGLFEAVYLETEFLEKKTDIWMSYDLIIFGTPVHLIKNQIKNIPKDFPGTITDMGSTKETIVQAVEDYFTPQSTHNYVSSHPMCGSENSGPESAISDLYENKLCILTPLPGSNPKVLAKLQKFWEDLGMDTFILEGQKHDEILAYLSHAPHILSSLMVNWAEEAIGKENSQSPQPIMGGGFRDMARIAGSNPEMWESIVGENKGYILRSLENFQTHLNTAIQLLKKDELSAWKEFFSHAYESKKKLLGKQ